MKKYHLAQINIGIAVDEMDSSAMQGFASRLEEINALADSAGGFVWRLQTEEGDSTSVRVYDDPLQMVNISVWETIEALKTFVYKSIHVELIQDREAWFKKMAEVHQTLWWIPAGHIPSIEEAKQKLEHFKQHGATQEAFTFGKPFPSP
jgi:hypothetical protein